MTATFLNQTSEVPIISPGKIFSRIYIERDLLERTEAQTVLRSLDARRRGIPIIPIEHYKDLFNRPRQDFRLQKSQQALIIAAEREKLIYRGNERINSWSKGRLFYNALVRNCVYDCDYCFLQGMHPSGHAVMFVNNGDFIQAAERELQNGPMYMSISYLSEILTFEPLFPYCRQWIDFASDREDFELEIRTKSDYFEAISSLNPRQNCYLVWSISPDQVARKHERGCPSLQSRLFSASRAAKAGWPLKLTFDPVIRVENWRQQYRRAIEQTFRRIDPALVREVSFGVFRLGKDHLETIRRVRTDAPHLQREYWPQGPGQVMTYTPGEVEEVRHFMEDQLSAYLDDSRIFFVHG